VRVLGPTDQSLLRHKDWSVGYISDPLSMLVRGREHKVHQPWDHDLSEPRAEASDQLSSTPAGQKHKVDHIEA